MEEDPKTNNNGNEDDANKGLSVHDTLDRMHVIVMRMTRSRWNRIVPATVEGMTF